MQLIRIIERIQREFPNVKAGEIIEDLNDIQKDFCIETEILKKSTNLTVVANTVTYTLTTEFPTLDKVLRVDFLNSTGTLADRENTLKMDIKPDGTITFYDYYGQAITTIPSGITPKFYYTYIPTALVVGTLTASPDIPSQLHEGLIYGELARLHSSTPTIIKQFQDGSIAKTKDFQSIQLNESKYREYVIKAKRLANAEKNELDFKTNADQF